MDRMSALATSSQQWKGRVTQSDATKFTVAHKMASASTSSVPSLVSGMSTGVTRSPEQLLTPTGSPHLERKKRSPCQKIFKSKTGGNIPSLANKSSPSSPRKNFRRSISTPQDSERKGQPHKEVSRQNHIFKLTNKVIFVFPAEAPEGTSVSVPQVDDDSFNAFFSKVPDSVSLNSEDAPELNEADFDHISVTASQL
ncbi:hypothetical protein E2C01_088172 [Portunus trituberculatus]|uniref:Uncharacterized protein n=1 Tax=Portunus trituberculatus TaxID=210409 RepID=A0A5B7JFZ2_PORTR|nr:hypothetical protein [Portunus trituberculatus]